jgi:hypothetical protein
LNLADPYAAAGTSLAALSTNGRYGSFAADDLERMKKQF